MLGATPPAAEKITNPYSTVSIHTFVTKAMAMNATFDTGLRCSEIVMLEIEDLDMDAQRLLVRFGKGNKQRVVPFADRCRDAVAA